MAYKIMLAKTTAQLDQVFKLRHKVFVEEERLLQPTTDGRIIDRFDAYPTTSNLIVSDGKQIVGAFRLAIDSSEGLPADAYFDFRQHVPEDSRLMHTSLLCITQEYRCPRLTTGLTLMAAYFAETHGITHVVAPINPVMAKLLKRVGYRTVGEEFIEPHTQAAVLPMLLDMCDLKDFFLNFIKQNKLQPFLQSYERWFYQKGEMVIEAGTVGQEAFVIIEGTLEARIAGTSQVLGKLGPGEIIGELALLTDEPRSADVIATSDVQMMVLPKEEFLSSFLSQPEQALRLFKLLSKRTQNLTNQLAKNNHH